MTTARSCGILQLVKGLAKVQTTAGEIAGFLGSLVVSISMFVTVKFSFNIEASMEVFMATNMFNILQSVWFEVASLWG
jgi:hypothetical protein